jgi:hypothetical protein
MVDGKNKLHATQFRRSTINYEPSTKLASVIGLAPIRPGLKDRLLDLLCIHGLEKVEGCRVASYRFADASAGENLQPVTFNLQRVYRRTFRVL